MGPQEVVNHAVTVKTAAGRPVEYGLYTTTVGVFW